MKLRKRSSDDMNIAFLDVICCGFGAIILLLLITKIMDPAAIVDSPETTDAGIAELQEQLFDVRGDARVENEDLTAKREQLSKIKKYVAQLQGELTVLRGEFNATDDDADTNTLLAGELASARQALTEEMQRLLGESSQRSNDIIGGIPVDSEYLIFIIDTSGSMVNSAWPRLQREIIATLDVYPEVKGIQIMNDMGNYMFTRFRQKWMTDEPHRRRAIVRSLQNWTPFSNSSPVEGLEAAVRTYYEPGKKISIFVYGDDFSGGSIERVLMTIDGINREIEDGKRLVRIHAVGFPHLIAGRGVRPGASSTRFAALMREMTFRNGGSFVGLVAE
ncbi:MAG: hypothetical protein AB8B48_17575 [Pseudomonadales bacterium]